MEKIHLRFLSQLVTKVGCELRNPNSGFGILSYSFLFFLILFLIAFDLEVTTLS